jgi:hypothetical protein
MDVLRLQRTEDDDHFLLTMVDVFSRYAVVVKLKAATAKQAIRALNDHILTISRPRGIVTDGGSEFKSIFRDTIKQMNILHHVTTPHHSEGHGVIERFNRTFTRTLSHLLGCRDTMEWPDFMGAALVAYNCTPHSAHGLVPLHVFFDTVDRAILPSTQASVTQDSPAVSSALEMVAARAAMKETVTAKLKEYHDKMHCSLQEQRRSTRKLGLGDTVLVFRESGSRLIDKWNDRFDGPFVVMEVVGETKYIVQRIGSDDKPQTEHIDNLVAAPILPQHTSVFSNDSFTEEQLADVNPSVIHQAGRITRQKYEVESVAGKRGGKFLIKWKGYDVATWEPIKNLDCSRLIKHWEMLSTDDKKKLQQLHDPTSRTSSTLIASVTLIPLSDTVNVQRSDTFVNARLDKLPFGSMITAVCAKVGIHPSQLVMTWSSPDCRTFARANTSNISRGNHYRNHEIYSHPPKDEIDDKRMMAIQHDILVQSLMESMLTTQASDPHALFVMENPSASLHRRTFVRMFELLIGLKCQLVHYCAYLAPMLKPTDIWTNFDWRPSGSTGNGKCGQRCVQGVVHSADASGRRSYRHPVNIGGCAAKLPKGPFASARVPDALHRELLNDALLMHEKRGTADGRTYVLELFAGSTAFGSLVREAGLSYIAVDCSSLSAKCFRHLHVSEGATFTTLQL